MFTITSERRFFLGSAVEDKMLGLKDSIFVKTYSSDDARLDKSELNEYAAKWWAAPAMQGKGIPMEGITTIL